MSTSFVGTEVFLNKMIACEYAGKARQGKVSKVTPSVITIEYQGNGRIEYRSMTIDKIRNLEILK